MAIAVKISLEHDSNVIYQQKDNTEFQVIKLMNHKHSPINVVNVYTRLNHLTDFDNIKKDMKSYIISGDFNAHSTAWGFKNCPLN